MGIVVCARDPAVQHASNTTRNITVEKKWFVWRNLLQHNISLTIHAGTSEPAVSCVLLVIMSRRVQRGVSGGGKGRGHDPPRFAPVGQVSFTLALTFANEEAIILRYVSNGRTGCTVTARLSFECCLAGSNDPPSSFHDLFICMAIAESMWRIESPRECNRPVVRTPLRTKLTTYANAYFVISLS